MAFQKIMHAFLWTGTDMFQNGKHLSGLGVLDLHLLGVALHARWLWLHRTDPSRA
jgi:hypothetical protein